MEEKRKCSGCGGELSELGLLAQEGLPGDAKVYCPLCATAKAANELMAKAETAPTARELEDFARDYVARKASRYGPLEFKVQEEGGKLILTIRRVEQ